MRPLRQWAGTDAGRGILRARPGVPTVAATPGLRPLGLGGGGRDGMVSVPAAHRPETPAPLVVLLHGAGGMARRSITYWTDVADAHGLLLLAPDARGRTWDVIEGGYGADIAFMDAALAQIFASCAVDAARVCLCGFSDGASYALSVGLANGDLFTHLVAFSPGFSAPPRYTSNPRLFVSHGTRDAVLPIASCSRRLVPPLVAMGYAVTYREFDGPHTVPPEITAEARTWFLEQ